MREAFPNKTGQVCDIRRSADSSDGEIQFGWSDSWSASKHFLDNDRHRSAFERAKHQWQQKPREKFARVIRTEHWRQ